MTEEKTEETKTCYDCKFRRTLDFDAHSSCVNVGASVKGEDHGIKNGWFYWPMNFDPVWVKSCDGFQLKK